MASFNTPILNIRWTAPKHPLKFSWIFIGAQLHTNGIVPTLPQMLRSGSMEMSVCDSIIKPSCPPSLVHIHAKILVMQSSPLMKYVEINKVGIITSGCKGMWQIQLLAMANGYWRWLMAIADSFDLRPSTLVLWPLTLHSTPQRRTNQPINCTL